jgi:hypothetical protein
MKSFLFLVFILVTQILYSQGSQANRRELPVQKVFSTSVSLQKFDLFSQVHFSWHTKRMNYSTGLGFGLNRSYYQHQLFPELGIGLSTNLISLKTERKTTVFFGPELRITHAFLKVIDLHQFTSFFVGYYFQIGSKWSLIHRAGIGGLRENFRSSTTKNIGAATFAYYGSIGIGYAWN